MVLLRAAEGWPETAYHGKRAARSFYEGLVETVGGEAVIEELIDAGEIVFHPRTPHLRGLIVVNQKDRARGVLRNFV